MWALAYNKRNWARFVAAGLYKNDVVNGLSQQFSWDIVVLFEDKVSEDKRVMVRLEFKICALDKNFSSIWTYTTMMLPRVRNHHGEDVYIRDLVDFDVTMSTSRGKNIERIHDASTPEERRDFLNWARSVAQAKAESEDLDECDKMLGWASYTAKSATSPPEQHKSWSLQEEISKPFETALKLFQEELNQNEMAMEYGCSDLKQEHMIYTCDKEKHGVYQCQNALWIWPKLRNNHAIYVYQSDEGLKRVGNTIREKFLESVMIKGRPTINRFGFVTIKLSGKWIAKSIHKMLKDGIDTWAPKLPVERVIIDYPSVCEETDLDSFQRRAIRYTLMRITEDMLAQDVPDSMFQGENRNFNFPIDSRKVKEDLLALWFGLCKQKADWILYVTPIRQLEYIKMCFT
ncbi:hypothetical protein Tco_1376818, partial [Tanacetum coccineum]